MGRAVLGEGQLSDMWPTLKLREERCVICFQEAINNTGFEYSELRFTMLELLSISLRRGRSGNIYACIPVAEEGVGS
jgi:hypothetical protein